MMLTVLGERFRLMKHRRGFPSRAKSLTNGLLYTHWISELESHIAIITHQQYGRRGRRKVLPQLVELAIHFLETATEAYPHPIMYGADTPEERARGVRAVFRIFIVYDNTFGRWPDHEFLEAEKYRAILKEARDTDPRAVPSEFA